MSKKLMNEQLPTPVIAMRGSPRDRVLRHVRDALAAGASAVILTGCPFAVVDPLPPPAACRSSSAASLLTATVTVETSDGGTTKVTVVIIDTSSGASSGFTLKAGATVTGGTFASTTPSRYVVEPAAGATSFVIVIPAQCADYNSATVQLGIRVGVTLGATPDGGSGSAVISEVAAPDGG